MAKHIVILIAIMLLAGCSQPRTTTHTQGGVQPKTSRFHRLELKAGMDREEVESKIAAILNTPESYSPYANNLQGGDVQYRDGEWLLEVTYKAGGPAPWVENPDGTMEHYPPIDETVLKYRIERIPNQNLKATGSPAP